MENKLPTIKEIARRLNISISTVSRALHDHHSIGLKTKMSVNKLAKELKPVSNSNDIQPGDVFIKPGFPGHAMMVADVAINREGEKIFMLVQGYMPAQDIHIVKNLENEEISPWYKIPASGPLVTPEWIFDVRQLKRWQ